MTSTSSLVKKKKKNEDCDAEIAQSKLASAEITVLEQVTSYIEEEMRKQVHLIGNVVLDSVPVSDDEINNVVVANYETIQHHIENATLRAHHQLLYMIGGYEPERGVRAAGHRGYYLTGIAVTLSQALATYALRYLEDQEYKQVVPPYFMSQSAMAKVAELDDFDDQLYHVNTNSANDESKYLIATSEQPLCYYHVNEILNPKEMPIRYAGFSSCFRKEAGKHGKDTWGIFRVHQFDKVEQFVICEPEESEKLHEEMRDISERFLQSLGLPYRVVNIVSGALNNAAAKKYDIEGWFPGYGEFKELVSCSNCLDYQSRGLGIRYGKGQYVHMLNATLCAIPRTICCILENYQQADGIKVPDVLQKYVGKDFMPFVREEMLGSATNADGIKN